MDGGREIIGQAAAKVLGHGQLTEKELELFNELLDLSPEACLPHRREVDDSYEWGCAMLGAIAMVSVRRSTSGWATAEETISDWAKYPHCENCPLKAPSAV